MLSGLSFQLFKFPAMKTKSVLEFADVKAIAAAAEAEALKKDLARKFGSSITSAEFLAVIRSDTTLPNSRNQQTIFLLLAIQHHFFDAIEELLKYHKPYLTPAMINWLNSAGETVLIQAIALEKTQLVRLLLAHGADPDISSFSHHITPLMLAADRNNVEILELLLQCGVKAVSETASFAIEHNRDPAIIARLLEAATVSAEIPAAPAAPAALSTGAGAAAGSSDRPAAVSSCVTPEHMPPKELTEPKEEADNTGAEEWEIVPSDVSEPTQPPAAPTSFFSYFGLWRSSASQGPAGTGSGASDRTI